MSEGKSPRFLIDGALRAWPSEETSELDWDERAERIIARAQSGDAPKSMAQISDDDLLAAPLGMTSEEAQRSGGKSEERAPERRDRRSFQDLAKMAQTMGAPPSKPALASQTDVAAKDSGVLDFKEMAAADPAGSERAKSTPLASSGLFEEPHAAPAHAAHAAPAEAARAPASRKPAASENAKKEGSNVVALFGGLVAIAAVAAGAFFWVKQPPAATADKVAIAPPPSVQAPKAESPKPTAAPDNAIDPAALPVAVPATVALTATAPFPVASGVMPLAAPRPEATAIAAPPAASASAIASASPAPTSSGSLEDQMRQAAGPGTSAPPPAADTAQTPSNIPMKPSQGAVSGAIGAVMFAARQCLGPDDPVSQASIVFQSNGSVQSVTITGGAQGKPAEACIRQALMRAKIAPFAQTTFTAYATIRPN
jgi:hypothetical protein